MYRENRTTNSDNKLEESKFAAHKILMTQKEVEESFQTEYENVGSAANGACRLEASTL